MALMKLIGVARELVFDFVPCARCVTGGEGLPVVLHLRLRTERHQLQRPHHDLPEVPHDGFGRFGLGHARN
jgi:hypothetical protein